jgi:hypothetical protein
MNVAELDDVAEPRQLRGAVTLAHLTVRIQHLEDTLGGGKWLVAGSH